MNRTWNDFNLMKEQNLISLEEFITALQALPYPAALISWIPGTHNYEGVSTPMDS